MKRLLSAAHSREAVALGVEHFEIGGAACLVAKLREPGTLGQRGD